VLSWTLRTTWTIACGVMIFSPTTVQPGGGRQLSRTVSMGEGETRRQGHTLEAGLEQLELGPALSDVDHFTELRLAHLGLAALIDEPPPPVLPEREEGLDPALAPVLAGEDPEPALERPRSSRRDVRELEEGREAREGGLGEEGVQSHDARARE